MTTNETNAAPITTVNIPIPMWRTNVRITVAPNQGDADWMNQAILENYDDHEDNFNARGRAYGVFSSGGVRVAPMLFRVFTPEIIAHEVDHAASFIMQYLGIPECSETAEVRANLVGYITGQIFQDDTLRGLINWNSGGPKVPSFEEFTFTPGDHFESGEITVETLETMREKFDARLLEELAKKEREEKDQKRIHDLCETLDEVHMAKLQRWCRDKERDWATMVEKLAEEQAKRNAAEHRGITVDQVRFPSPEEYEAIFADVAKRMTAATQRIIEEQGKAFRKKFFAGK